MRQAVFPIDIESRHALALLFPDEEKGLLLSCLQGHMGQAYGDHPHHPSMALLAIGDFACFGGTPKMPIARLLAGKLALQPEKAWIIPAQTQAWQEPLKALVPSFFQPGTRYALKQAQPFDIAKLKALCENVPPEYTLHEIDHALYHAALSASWSRDFCSQFLSSEDYAKRGLGVVALWNGEIVSGASSYVVYDKGIEIQVDTRADMRQKGLAAACCAKLILCCLERGIMPSWDAVDMRSVALAQKLGYTLDKPYPIWEVQFEWNKALS